MVMFVGTKHRIVLYTSPPESNLRLIFWTTLGLEYLGEGGWSMNAEAQAHQT